MSPRLLFWTAPALVSLALLSGCATSSTASKPAPEPPRPQEVKPAPPAPAPKRVRRDKERPPAPPAPVPTPAPAPAPEPAPVRLQSVSLLTAELVCLPGGKVELREPTERPADVLPFQPGVMTAPERLAGPRPAYTQEALDHQIQGVSIVRCILKRSGTMHSCRIIKSLPYMDEAVVSSLCSSRYVSAKLQGQPVDVEHTFTTRLALP